MFRSDEDDRVATPALADSLGVTASTVSATLGRLEERGLVDRIAEVLGHRSVDRHGDPVPDADPSLSERSETTRLADATEGERVLVQRIRQAGDGELRDLADAGIRPDVELAVVDVGSFGMVTVETATDQWSRPEEVARIIDVAPVSAIEGGTREAGRRVTRSPLATRAPGVHRLSTIDDSVVGGG